jgi:hypothetical protein
MPVVRVEKHLLRESGGAPFTVLGDDASTMDQLRLLAARHGWVCEVSPGGPGEFRAQFRPVR